MLYSNFIENILGTQGVKLKGFEFKGNIYKVEVEMPRKANKCPVCGEQTDRIHDYREQKVKGGQFNGYYIELLYRKRRYRCPRCSKKFYEDNSIVGRYQRMTGMMIMTVLEMLKGAESFTEIAQRMNLTRPTVTRLFKLLNREKPKELPEVLGIDEFRGNANGEKFQVILTDLKEHKVLDILPKRSENYLLRYFMSFPKEQRQKVQYFVSDMYTPYVEVAKTCFPNAIHIVDRYHWIRQLLWAFENIRKREQKRFSKGHRLYFKRSRQLLLKPFNCLKDDDQQVVLNILNLSDDLLEAYFYKEQLYILLHEQDTKKRKKAFVEFADGMKQSGIHELERCADTYYHWLTGILASLEYPYSNGFTEGCNNKIKVLKRVAYGYRNFDVFRNKILFAF